MNLSRRLWQPSFFPSSGGSLPYALISDPFFFVSQLSKQHCQLTLDAFSPEGVLHPSSTVSSTISVQAFTPILGTLLLSSNPLVGGAARHAVVHLLRRMKKADNSNVRDPTTPLYLSAENCEQEEDEMDWVTGLFGRGERDMFRTEILQQVVIGMGRLDMDVDDQHDYNDLSRAHRQDMGHEAVIARGEEDIGREQSELGKINYTGPYLPLLASPLSSASSAASQASTSSSTLSQTSHVEHPSQIHPVEEIAIEEDWVPSAPRPTHRTLPSPRHSTTWSSPDLSDPAHPASSLDSTTDPRHFCSEELGSRGDHSLHGGSQNSYGCGSEESESDEQAAVGRLSSMSLMAAVVASGLLDVCLSLESVSHLIS